MYNFGGNYLPICCSHKAFSSLYKQASAIQSPDALLRGVIAISAHWIPNVDTEAVDQELQRYVNTIRARVKSRSSQALMAHMHEFLFDEMGFAGNMLDYYNPSNSQLPIVLEKKLGNPVLLALIYKIVAERLGFQAWGIGLPGHFLVGIKCDQDQAMVDAFDRGRLISSEEAHARMKEIFSSEVEWSEKFLRPASNQHWLTRIIQNLINTFGTARQYQNVAALLEMEIALWPNMPTLWRDLGLVLASIGMSKQAARWLSTYIQNAPNDPQIENIQQMLDVLSDGNNKAR